jgi:hypothetical protein
LARIWQAIFEVSKMKKWLWIFLLSLTCLGLGTTGCGFWPNNGTNQIQLSVYPSLCVDVLDASTAQGQLLQLYPCGAGKMSQEWIFKPINNNQNFLIVNMNSGKCMSVSSPYDDYPGQVVLQTACDQTDPDMVWTINDLTGGSGVRFVAQSSGECLDDPYGETAGIPTLQQYTCDSNDPAQGWNINPVGKGNTP